MKNKFKILAIRSGQFTGREEVFFLNAKDQIMAFDILMEKHGISYQDKLNGVHDKRSV